MNTKPINALAFSEEELVKQEENLKAWIGVFESLARFAKMTPGDESHLDMRVSYDDRLLKGVTTDKIELKRYMDELTEWPEMTGIFRVSFGYDEEFLFLFKFNMCSILTSGDSHNGSDLIREKVKILESQVAMIQTLQGTKLEFAWRSCHDEVTPNDGLIILDKWIKLVYHANNMCNTHPKILLEGEPGQKREELRHLLKTPIEDLELSVRAYNCIKAAKINSLEGLLQYTKDDLLKFRNLGKNCVAEIEALLASKGLSFDMDLSELQGE